MKKEDLEILKENQPIAIGLVFGVMFWMNYVFKKSLDFNLRMI